MGYLIGRKMALLHPPKTAGIWARYACKSVGLEWQRYAGDGSPPCQHSDDPPPPGRKTMLFVRHPACWLRSFWMYHQRTNWLEYTDSPGFVFYANHRTGEDFPMFAERYLEKMPGAIGRMFERYERHADMIGHVETIVEDLKRFISEVHPKLNLDAIEDIEPRNDSPTHQKRLVSYAPGQRVAVLAAEHRLMERHGY